MMANECLNDRLRVCEIHDNSLHFERVVGLVDSTMDNRIDTCMVTICIGVNEPTTLDALRYITRSA